MTSVSLSNNKTEQKFYPQLDGLRAVAVLLVFIRHMDDMALPSFLVPFYTVGWIGVDAFFVLSGFLITKILLSTPKEPRAYSYFVARRTLRTWPLYFVVLLLVYITLLHTPTSAHPNWLQHVFFVQNFSPEFVARSLTPTWSLCVEEHFYFLWPLLMFVLPRRFLAWFLAGAFLCSPIVRLWGLHGVFTLKQIYTETQFHLDGLLAGGMVALVFARLGERSKVLLWAGCLCLILGAALSFVNFRESWNLDKGNTLVFGFTFLAITFAGLLMLLLQDLWRAPAWLFSFRPLRYIGKISYGIYILHEAVVSFVARIPLNRLAGISWTEWYIAVPLRAILVILAAAVSYRFFESPILRLKDRLR